MSLSALTAQVVASYVEKNRLPAGELPDFIAVVHRALAATEAPEASASDGPPPLTRAQIRRSIRPDGLISFIDQKPYKVLKRHLTVQGMTPAQYRERFGLPADYPMTASDYTATRSALAKASGLGVKSGRKARRA